MYCITQEKKTPNGTKKLYLSPKGDGTYCWIPDKDGFICLWKALGDAVIFNIENLKDVGTVEQFKESLMVVHEVEKNGMVVKVKE